MLRASALQHSLLCVHDGMRASIQLPGRAGQAPRGCIHRCKPHVTRRSPRAHAVDEASASDGPSTSGRQLVDKAALLQGLARQYTKGLPDDALVNKLDLDELTEGDIARASRLDGALKVHTVQWYPGHIAKAERQLKEQLRMVDVVLEVRDARIPLSTCHPQVPQWVGNKPRLIVFNRGDMVSKEDLTAWQQHLEATGQRVYWTNGKEGKGTHGLKRAVLKASQAINDKRTRRGLQPRPVRACVIGFPNIGKSALINRLLGRRVVDSAPRPGVTRVLRWIRLGGDLDLLDAPGVIPASFNNQLAAQRLAMCNDIGQASYIDSLIAAAMIIRFKQLPTARRICRRMGERYKVGDPWRMTAEDFVVALADTLFGGDVEKAGMRLLNDYRNGYLGDFALETPADDPAASSSSGSKKEGGSSSSSSSGGGNSKAADAGVDS